MATTSTFFGGGGSSGSGASSSSSSGSRQACIETFGTGAYEVFYTDGTFTVPDGITSLRVKTYGPGGASISGPGGGGGGYAMGCITTAAGCTFAVTVGMGGKQFQVNREDFRCSNPPTEYVNTNPTTTNFGSGLVCATAGQNGQMGYHRPICLNNTCVVNCFNYSAQSSMCCCRNCGGVGGGTCAAVTYCGGAGFCLCTSCACSSICCCCRLLEMQGSTFGGGGGATQCGNGHFGFTYKRYCCLYLSCLGSVATGGAGALGGNTFCHCCNAGRNKTGTNYCIWEVPCTADGWGASRDDMQRVNYSFNASKDKNQFDTSGTTYPGSSVDRSSTYESWVVEKYGWSRDNPDQPVPGEHLSGAGGKTINMSFGQDFHNTGMGYCDTNATEMCCINATREWNDYRTSLKAGDGEPGGGGGAILARNGIQDDGMGQCDGCCYVWLCTRYWVQAGAGGFASGGGGVGFKCCLGLCSTSCCKIYNTYWIETGRGGIGGGSGGMYSYPFEGCNMRVCGATITGEGGHGLVVVEY